MNHINTKKPENIFLIIGILFGLSLLLINPPFQAPDEPAHFYKAYSLSNGIIFPTKINNSVGFILPSNLITTSNNFSYLHHQRTKVNNYNISLFDVSPENTIFIDLSSGTIVTYSPIPYLVSAFSISIGKLFNLSPLMLMYLGRLANLLAWILFTYLAIRITPIYKWVFLLLALMPMTLFIGASLSGDSFIICISFLLTAIFLKFIFDDTKKTINNKDIVILFIISLFLALSKSFYALIILMFFMIPVNKFGSFKKQLLFFIMLVLPILIIAGYWDLISQQYFISGGSKSVAGQMQYLLSNLTVIPSIIFNTFIHSWKFQLTSFVGYFGWLTVPLPSWLIYLYTICLFLVAIIDHNYIKIQIKQKIIFLSIFLLIFGFIISSLYISWTPVGFNEILGLQGRYFIPIIPLFLLLFYNNRITTDKRVLYLIPLFVIFTLLISILVIFWSYYNF